MNRNLTALALIGVAALGLAGCSAGGTEGGSSGRPSSTPSASASSSASGTPGSGGQSVEEACAVVTDTMQNAAEQFQNVSAENPEGAADALRAAADAIAQAQGDIDNAEIAALLPDIEEGFSTLSEAMSALAEGDLGRVDDLQSVSAELQGSFAAFQELCLS